MIRVKGNMIAPQAIEEETIRVGSCNKDGLIAERLGSYYPEDIVGQTKYIHFGKH